MKLTTPRKCGDASITGMKSSLFTKADIDRAQRLVTCTANTSAIDMDDEVVVPEGAPADGRAYFDRAKTIYLNHNYDQPIGRMRWRKLVKGAWMVQFHISDKTELARDTFELIDDGVIGGTSIGFEAKDRSEPTPEEVDLYGPASVVTREWDWIEHSVTSMPCNPEAIIQAVERGTPSLDDDKAAKLDALVCKGLVSRKTGRAIGLPDRKIVSVPSLERVVVPTPKEILTI